MMLNSENFTTSYLHRINFHQNIELNRQTLFALQEAHLFNVPFENLDIHYGIEIKLELEPIFEKIVLKKRGGFCYELNGLFYQLLKELGFEVKLISGRVHTKDGNYGQEYEHMAVIATLDHRQYLVDVGFGKFSLHPLEIKKGLVLHDPYGQFQFEEEQDSYLSVSMVSQDVLDPQYLFKTTPRFFSEFEEMCNYYQTSKDAHFTHKKMISILTNEGRITLNDQQIKITREENEEILIFDAREFELKLQQYFRIKI